MALWLKSSAARALVTAFLFASAAANVAWADDDHYNQVLVGERPAGMGGAYTAVSDDASGLYHNPAGTVYASGSNLSVSLNAFSTYVKHYKNAIGANDYIRRSSALAPNFFGVMQHTDWGTLGFSYAMPESILEEQDTTMANPVSGLSQYTINFNREINTYNIGPTWAKSVSNDLSVGVTLYAHYKKYKLTSMQYLLKPDPLVYLLTITQKSEEFGFRPVLGAVWSPQGGKYAVGVSLSRTYVMSASRYYQSISKPYTGATSTNASFASVNSSTQTEYPLTAKFGLAYFPSSSMLISGDVSYHSNTNTWDEIYGLANDHPSVINVAVGMEKYFSSAFALRAGFYTDMSNRRSAVDYDKVDLYGLALSSTYFSKNSSVTFGLNYSSGKGEALINTANPAPGELVMSNLMVFLGSSYSY